MRRLTRYISLAYAYLLRSLKKGQQVRNVDRLWIFDNFIMFSVYIFLISREMHLCKFCACNNSGFDAFKLIPRMLNSYHTRTSQLFYFSFFFVRYITCDISNILVPTGCRLHIKMSQYNKQEWNASQFVSTNEPISWHWFVIWNPFETGVSNARKYRNGIRPFGVPPSYINDNMRRMTGITHLLRSMLSWRHVSHNEKQSK